MALKDNLPAPYVSLADAEVLLIDTELWIHKNDEQKEEALGWGRIYLDSNYTHSFTEDDIPEVILLANSLLANYHFTESLFDRQSTNLNPISEEEVEAGSVKSRKRYNGNRTWKDPFPNITQLIKGYSRLTAISSDNPVVRA